ncbi:glutamate-1-semialdehyde 2,1-aminomutase [Parasphingorhabdus litoris]|uniref:Glutamate-1-semialdehyde 2,1-aminomutase n=1 Tax=Parasphingorhabdus litoris TaxID=394733 RepID=A0ABN1A3C2_9SPHN|nr:aminotransferase class III-fold pyridoxal phosphate-dependent enzyme [Parasphingorhabdus litoris]
MSVQQLTYPRPEKGSGFDLTIPRSPIVDAYRQSTQGSEVLHLRAEQALAGGNSRQVSYWSPHPIAIASADGAHLTDVDGRRYIDFTNNYTSLVHGHAYPPILETVDRQIKNGTVWSAQNEHQIDLAELLVERIPAIDKVRFTNSGTEASNLALSIARAVTKRHKILMSRFGYHGSLTETETGSFNHDYPATTYLGEYNNAESFENILEHHGEEIAAVFLEPVLGSAGIIAADREFLLRVKEAAHKAGALFILDEVVTFRLHEGGRQKALGIEADLTMLGKLIGGGFPVGAVGGPDDLMDVFQSSDLRTYHSGTFNGNPVTTAAGVVAVRDLTQKSIDEMEKLAERLKNGLAAAAQKVNLPFCVSHVGSLMNVFFSNEIPQAALMREDQAAMSRFHIAALNQGLFIAGRGLMAMSTIMDEALIDEAIDRAAVAMSDVAAEL